VNLCNGLKHGSVSAGCLGSVKEMTCRLTDWITIRVLLKMLIVTIWSRYLAPFTEPEFSVPWSQQPPMDSLLCQLNLVHVPLPYCVKIHCSVHVGLPSDPFLSGFMMKILYACLVSGMRNLLLGFKHHNCLCLSECLQILELCILPANVRFSGAQAPVCQR
jgi:hypothetical protein